jgi:23S rRNA pseudouridine1911/1915/1917 synthase
LESIEAFKLLAKQIESSNGEAKKLIDRGLVYLSGRKVNIARAKVPVSSKFRVKNIDQIVKIFEDDKIIAVNKPSFLDSDEVLKGFKGAKLLHRLDRETSGVLVLSKDEDFRGKLIAEFKNRRVYKEYTAWVNGKIIEPFSITKRLKSVQRGGRKVTVVDKSGEEAITHIEPELLVGKRSRVKAIIETGRTHQIRVHLSSNGTPIIGDKNYGGADFDRVMLHSRALKILDYSFKAPEPKIFERFLNG